MSHSWLTICTRVKACQDFYFCPLRVIHHCRWVYEPVPLTEHQEYHTTSVVLWDTSKAVLRVGNSSIQAMLLFSQSVSRIDFGNKLQLTLNLFMICLMRLPRFPNRKKRPPNRIQRKVELIDYIKIKPPLIKGSNSNVCLSLPPCREGRLHSAGPGGQ